MSLDLTKTAPWSSDTHDLLTRTLSHISEAYLLLPDGETITLELEDGTVSWDETRSPRVQANLTCRVPDDQVTLDRIDPRTGARLIIAAGYRRPDQTDDIHEFVDLGLRSRRVTRPDDRMTLEAMSDEAILIDGAATASGNVTASTTTAAIGIIIDQIFDPYPTVTVSTGTTPAVSGLLFDDRWDAVQDLADTIDAQVYDNGLRAWYIAPAPNLATLSALEVSVGTNGTIISSDTGLSRDDGWANYVWLQYEWKNSSGVESRIRSFRRITSGPYAAVANNYRILRFDRTVSTTQAKADAAATALVRRTVTRGRSFSLEAISAYWLRPGMTIQVQLPLGDPELHLVTAVDFDLLSGSMRVTTRLPDNPGTVGA